jgi:N-acyl homoserine lactone hydrolase
MSTPSRVRRLYLGSIESPLGAATPFHGYVVAHPGGVVLVDTGMAPGHDAGGDVTLVLRAISDALADHGLVPRDVTHVLTTHLHWDHYGQNTTFRHAPFVVQRAELERARREEPLIAEYFDVVDAGFELLEGDAEVAPGVHALATPGHTIGHQSVLVEGAGGTGEGRELIVGDAAYTADVWDHPDDVVTGGGPLFTELGLPAAWLRRKQVTSGDFAMWRESLERLRTLEGVTARHFCHDRRIPRRAAVAA